MTGRRSAQIRGGDAGEFVHPRLASQQFQVPQCAGAAPLTLIYYRFGHYRHMLGDGAQSDLLLHRDSTAGSVRYTLRPEAVAAFAAIGLLEA